MYLYIFEDGEVKTATSFCDDDKQTVEIGVLTVIDIEATPPATYYGGRWHGLESAYA